MTAIESVIRLAHRVWGGSIALNERCVDAEKRIAVIADAAIAVRSNRELTTEVRPDLVPFANRVSNDVARGDWDSVATRLSEAILATAAEWEIERAKPDVDECVRRMLEILNPHTAVR